MSVRSLVGWCLAVLLSLLFVAVGGGKFLFPSWEPGSQGGVTRLVLVGLYGVLVREVADREREVGSHRARRDAGAPRAARGGRWSSVFGTGVAVSLPASWWLSRFIESRLYGVEPLDPAIPGDGCRRSGAHCAPTWPV